MMHIVRGLVETAEFVYEAVDIFAQFHSLFDTSHCGLG
jgi:hypothetical protein